MVDTNLVDEYGLILRFPVKRSLRIGQIGLCAKLNIKTTRRRKTLRGFQYL